MKKRANLRSAGAMIALAIASPAAAETMKLNGTELTYVSEGSGPAIVFVHGSISDHRVWEPLKETIAKEARFISYDLRYFGEAEWPDKGESFSLATHVDDLIALIEELDIGPVLLATWSYSGEIGLKAAIARPDLFTGMIHYEPAIPSMLKGVAGASTASAELNAAYGPAMKPLKAGDTATASLRFLEAVFRMPEGAASAEPEEWQAIWKLNGRTLPLQSADDGKPLLSCADLEAIETQTLVVKGADTFTRYAMMAERVADCVPNGLIVNWDGVNHDGPYRRPEAFATTILAFQSILAD